MLSKRFNSILSKLSKSERLLSTWAIFQSFMLRLVIQGFYFVILARTYPPKSYGALVGIVAIVSIFIPFASWGSEQILIQNVSRDQTLFQEYWGTGILKTLVFGSILMSLILIVYSFFPIPDISIYVVFFVALANLIFLRLNDLTRDAFVAVGLLNYAAKTIVLVSLNRFVAVLVLIILFDHPSIITWTILYCLATFISAMMSTFLVVKQESFPKFKLSKVTSELKLGMSYAVGISAQSIYNDLDKSMLVKLSGTAAAGIYGAAYQILDVAFTPILSIAMASFRNFFQKGASGINGSLELCKKILPISLGYSCIAVLGLIVCAPLVPKILGTEYGDAAIALAWLSPTVLFRCIHIFAADTLTGADLQTVRSTSQVIAAIINGLLNLCLIPLYSWRGAIGATIISEILLGVILWSAVYFYSRKAA